MDKISLTMLTDFYEITMANGYFQNGLKEKIAVGYMVFKAIIKRKAMGY